MQEMAMQHFSCQAVLGPNGTHDRVPIRASYAVMDHVADLVNGKTFVEVGSRFGDLIDCVSRRTASAVSIEADQKYCPKLALRAEASSGRWKSVCAYFDSKLPNMPAAEFYFAWVQQYLDVGFLSALHEHQVRGAVPKSARFALAFSGREMPGEYNCGHALQCFAESSSSVSYNEGKWFRGHGVTTVAVFAPAKLNMSAVRYATTGVCDRNKHPHSGWRNRVKEACSFAGRR